MFGQSLLSAFGIACTTDTDQLFPGTAQATTVATYQLNNATTSIPNNTYPGSPTNITYAAGKFGNAAVFNGSNSRIDTGISSISSPFAVSMWINEAVLGSGMFWSNWNSTSTDMYWQVDPDGRLRISIDGFSQQFFGTAGDVTINTWHHVVVTLSAGQYEVYLDGNSLGTSTTSVTTFNSGANYIIGNSAKPGTQYPFNGKIDQVRLFYQALTQSAVTALYNETTTTATSASIDYESATPSIAYYKMSDATDQLGNYNGTATNVNFSTEGKFGFAGAFNGSSSQIELPSNPIGTNLIGSISLWLQGASFGNSATSTDIAFYNRNPYVLIDTYQNNLRVIVKNSSSSNTTISYALSNFNTSDWYNIAVVLTGVSSTFTLYVNGSSVGTATAPSSTLNVASTALIGLNSATWNGKIDQIRIYDSAISAADVTTLYKEVECEPAAINALENFNTVLYTGNGSTQSISTVGFQPGFTWIKSRNAAGSHIVTDVVRGNGEELYPDLTNAEGTVNRISLISDGFNVTQAAYPNINNNTYVAWNWKAGGNAVSNTDGGNNSAMVSANPDAGFSIITYTGNNANNSSVGHGLNQAPEMFIYKRTSSASSWLIVHKDVNNYQAYLQFTTGTPTNSSTMQSPTDSVIRFNTTSPTFNGSGQDWLIYAFHSIPGYSKIGSYIGNGSITGPEIYLGFEPAFVMVKNTTGTGLWLISDNKRQVAATKTTYLQAQSSAAEYSPYTWIEYLNNGFQLKNNGSSLNTNGSTYIYMAFAAS